IGRGVAQACSVWASLLSVEETSVGSMQIKKSGTNRAGFGFCASGAGSNGSWRMASRLGEPFLYDVVFMD
ncbi:hypothetical protein, partial [Aeromonas salmonicida]|uniref:hypothetical protein n=1 Tax=Aeromonas salmonicida TaxID=645 RepID=UPI001EE6AE99